MTNCAVAQYFFLVLLIVPFSSAQCGNSLGPWERAANIPVQHLVESAAVVMNNKLYILGAFSGNSPTTGRPLATNRVDIYDPVSDSWSRGSDTPFFRSHAQAAAWTRSSLNPPPSNVGRSIYIAGGYIGDSPGPSSSEVWRYDILSDSWDSLPSLPGNRAGGGLVIDSRDRLHYISGLVDRYTDSGDHWYLDLRTTGSQWQKVLVDVPVPRGHYPAMAFGDYIYAPGGVTGHDAEPLVELDVFHRFDIYNQVWTQLKDLDFPRSHAEASTFWINNRLIQVCGRNKNPGYPGVLGTVAEYDIPSNSWQYLRSAPEVRTSAAGGVFTNINFRGRTGDFVILSTGGLDYNIPRTDTWLAQVTWNCSTPIPPNPVYRSESPATSVTSTTRRVEESTDSTARTTRDNSETSQTLNNNNNNTQQGNTHGNTQQSEATPTNDSATNNSPTSVDGAITLIRQQNGSSVVESISSILILIGLLSTTF